MHNRRPRRRPGRGLPKAARGVPGPGRVSPVPGRWWRQAWADRWSFLFGEIALSTFVVLAATGVYLAVFFDPDMTRAAYHGSYGRLHGVPVSRAYESTLHLSFDVRGGLLIRQIHHWAALIFVAAVCLLLLRLFFTGAFRRPRRLAWLIRLPLRPPWWPVRAPRRRVLSHATGIVGGKQTGTQDGGAWRPSPVCDEKIARARQTLR